MPSGGATKRPLLTGWLAVGVVDVHPMRGIGQKVDARAVLVDALHVVVSPHERRALRAHKVHLGAEVIRAATTAATPTTHHSHHHYHNFAPATPWVASRALATGHTARTSHTWVLRVRKLNNGQALDNGTAAPHGDLGGSGAPLECVEQPRT